MVSVACCGCLPRGRFGQITPAQHRRSMRLGSLRRQQPDSEHGPVPRSASGSRHDSLRPIIICSCSFRCAASVSVWPLPVCCPPLVWRGLPHTCSRWTCFYFFYTQFLICSGLLTDKAYAYGSSCLAVLYPFYFPQWGFAGRRPASYGVCATA